jgi:hypothetical protein
MERKIGCIGLISIASPESSTKVVSFSENVVSFELLSFCLFTVFVLTSESKVVSTFSPCRG